MRPLRGASDLHRALDGGRANPADFNPQKFATISVDAKTGQVLFSHEADTIRHPASLAKLMTLYIVFDEISAGRMKLSDSVVISPRAAAQTPTKLGLRAGGREAKFAPHGRFGLPAPPSASPRGP